MVGTVPAGDSTGDTAVLLALTRVAAAGEAVPVVTAVAVGWARPRVAGVGQRAAPLHIHPCSCRHLQCHRAARRPHAHTLRHRPAPSMSPCHRDRAQAHVVPPCPHGPQPDPHAHISVPIPVAPCPVPIPCVCPHTSCTSLYPVPPSMPTPPSHVPTPIALCPHPHALLPVPIPCGRPRALRHVPVPIPTVLCPHSHILHMSPFPVTHPVSLCPPPHPRAPSCPHPHATCHTSQPIPSPYLHTATEALLHLPAVPLQPPDAQRPQPQPLQPPGHVCRRLRAEGH